MRRNLTLSIFFLVAFSLPALAQNTTIINHFGGDTTGRGMEGFRLSGTEEHRIVINYYTPAGQGEIDRLSALVGAALNFYIDASVEMDRGKVKLKKSEKEMLRDMNDIVRNAVKYYSYKEIESFKGFSDQVKDKLSALKDLDFERSDLAAQVTDEASRKRLEYFFVQRHLNELKLLANLEVGNYSNTNLLVFDGSETTFVDAATRDSLLRALEFDPSAVLDPVRTGPGEEIIALLGSPDRSALPGETAAPSGDFTQQVLAMLQANNAKLDAMQGQIDELRAEQLRQFQAQQERTNELMQAQIDDLRGMVVELVKMNSGGAITSSGREISMPGPSVFNIPDAVNVYFPKGVTTLSAESRLILNEVVDILARNPGLNLVITGYADRTGNAMNNLMLSQERARAVKRFLAESGLTEDRFITRYLGDRDSQTENPGDRKVVLEFVPR